LNLTRPLRISVDDGAASDIRMADLALKYELEAVFYWPVEWISLGHDNGYEPLDYSQAGDIAKVFEIGSHTITHRHLTALPLLEAQKEIVGSKFMLEKMFNQEITKFCPPRGYTNELLTEFTLEFYQSQRLTKGDGLLHVHPNSGANGNLPWREYAKKIDVEELWCHSWELDRYELWDELEEYLSDLSS
jgi:peptidoglycan/xylan/chitin deacetylase (PgdA/CDA1 family)